MKIDEQHESALILLESIMGFIDHGLLVRNAAWLSGLKELHFDSTIAAARALLSAWREQSPEEGTI
jgi:hypothetical protein